MKKISFEEAKKKALHYCAYQERCHQEVKQKLYSLGLTTQQVDELLIFLLTEGFLKEERYAKAFAGGKFRLKKWGRLRIVRALEEKGLTKNCINIGLKEIDEEDYRQTLSDLLLKKRETMEDSNVYALRDKLSKYAIQKGFEPELVWQVLREVIPG